jgi:hypothetical protein
MTPLRVSIFAAIASILLLAVIFELIRSRRLPERYALLWMATGVVLLVFALWRDGSACWRDSRDRVSALGALPARLAFHPVVLLHYSTVISELAGATSCLRSDRAARAEAREDEPRAGLVVASPPALLESADERGSRADRRRADPRRHVRRLGRAAMRSQPPSWSCSGSPRSCGSSSRGASTPVDHGRRADLGARQVVRFERRHASPRGAFRRAHHLSGARLAAWLATSVGTAYAVARFSMSY